ncbi:MAG: hypothetical protein KGI33_12725 [Thaumarchaeota archaeon]|nr:hypothetical protein [Nitrososphaerota archaeon]
MQVSHKTNLWRTIPSKRWREDREISHSLAGTDNTGRFSSLAHFKRELRKFVGDTITGGRTRHLDGDSGASVYHDRKYFNKKREKS